MYRYTPRGRWASRGAPLRPQRPRMEWSPEKNQDDPNALHAPTLPKGPRGTLVILTRGEAGPQEYSGRPGRPSAKRNRNVTGWFSDELEKLVLAEQEFAQVGLN